MSACPHARSPMRLVTLTAAPPRAPIGRRGARLRGGAAAPVSAQPPQTPPWVSQTAGVGCLARRPTAHTRPSSPLCLRRRPSPAGPLPFPFPISAWSCATRHRPGLVSAECHLPLLPRPRGIPSGGCTRRAVGSASRSAAHSLVSPLRHSYRSPPSSLAPFTRVAVGAVSR